MSVDTIGDFLTVIRNGLMVGKRSIAVPHSIMKENVAKVLKDEGFIKDYKQEAGESFPSLKVQLKYVSGESVIHELTRVSTPGRRHYEKSSKITPVIGGLGVAIVTTSHGVMSDKQAKKLGIGGEIICHVW